MNLTPSSLPVGKTTPAEHGFVAHTPDPTRYHDMGGRTMLPRAMGTYQNHRSKGFHHEDKRKVYVDPQDPTTGYGASSVIDLAVLTEEQVTVAVAEGGDAGEIMDRLQVFQKNGAHLSPTLNDPQVFTQPATIPMPSPLAQAPAPVAQSWTPPLDPQVFIQPQTIPMQPQPPQTSQLAPQLDYEKLAGTLLRMQQPQIDPLAQPRAQQPPPPPEPQVVGFTEQQFRDALRMPYLSMEWQPPTVLATFFTAAGILRSQYHSIVRRGRRITLIVDTRKDSPMLFIPAVSGEGDPPIRIVVDSLKIDEKVYNLDFYSTYGVYDHYDLIVAEEPAEQDEDEWPKNGM